MEKKNNYKKKGIAFENELKRKLEGVGFPLVIRSSGSFSPADVIAFGWNEVYLFQCKSTEKTVVTNSLVESVLKNKSVKDLTNLPSRYIKVIAFKCKGNSDWVFYRWNNSEWIWIENKLF